MNEARITQLLKIPGWLSENEGRLLQKLAVKLPTDAVIVEIGSFQGKSTIFLGWGLKSGKIFAIDPHLGVTHSGQKKKQPTYTSFLKNIKRFGVNKLVVPIRKTSEAANKRWSKSIDLLHIDGLHEYKFVKQDIKLWLPYLKEGGIVICHDAFCPFPEVFQAVREEIFSKRQWKYLGASDSQIFAVKGKPENFLQGLNVARQKFFLTLASEIWHNNSLPENLRFFLVNRLLKIFFMSKYMWNFLVNKS